MIIQETTSAPVQTNVVAQPSRFKIKPSKRAFEILSGFYSDLVLAIPRELGANAWDAHVAAGTTDKQFEVHVPNLLEPWFSIRDFGTGLSPENVDLIYTTYFESTKTNDNDTDGCMGLGSKTPFNYTENFTVTVWFNGIKYTYNCFIDGGGGPSILPLANEPTEEPNGLEVKFAVKQDDIRTFVDKIRQAYQPFRVKPKLLGIHDIVYADIKYSHNGTNWALREGSQGRYNCRATALMGNYMYPIDVNNVCGYRLCEGITEEEMTKARHVLQNASIDLSFHIGDLAVAPNKEQLQYDTTNKTKIAVVKAAVVAYNELKAQIADKIKSPTTLWEAMLLYREVNGIDRSGCNLRSIIGDVEIPFNGNRVARDNIGVSEVTAKCLPNGAITSQKFELSTLSYSTGKNRFRIREHSRYTATELKIRFFYTNSDGIKKSRIKKYLLDNYKNGQFPVCYLIVDQSVDFVDMWAHQSYLGIDKATFVNIETLPKVVIPRTKYVPGTKQQRIADGVYTCEFSYSNLKDSRYCRASFAPKLLTVESTNTYYYVPFFYISPCHGELIGSTVLTDEQMGFILQYGIESGVIPEGVTCVYGVNKKTRPITKVGTWINVMDKIIAKIKKSETTKIEQKMFEVEHRNNCQVVWDNFSRIVSNGLVPALVADIADPKTKKFFQYLATIANKEYGMTSRDGVFSGLFSIKAVEHKAPQVTVDEVRNTFETKYMGIFSFMDNYNIPIKKIAKLINFIDTHTKNS